jgi:hypothetical protein
MELKVEKSSFILNFKSMPMGFLLALAMVLAFELCISMIPEYKLFDSPYEHAALALKGELVDKPNNFDIIVLGDCTGWAAIKPLEIENKLHKTVFNLAVNGAQTYLMSNVLMNRYLTNCTRKPGLVIVQVSATAILWPWGMNTDALNYHILPWFRVDDDFMNELSAPMRQVCYKYKFLQMIPSLKNQFFLKKGVWFPRLWNSNRAEFNKYISYYREQKGFYNEDLDPTKQQVKSITDIGEHFKQFKVSDFNLTYINKILETLLQNNIKVIVCLTPVRDDEMRIWSQYNLRAKLNTEIRELLSPYQNVIAFWDMQSVASEPKYFVDWSHLSSTGASRYTNELASRIKNLEHFL